MQHTLIYSASLSLLLAVSPSYGDQWERQLNYEGVAQNISGTASTVSYDWSEVNANRRMQLERGAYQETGFDIESLPPTAAGPQESSDMGVDWLEVEINRREQLERGAYQETGFDIESLPPTAAGPQESSDMGVDWLEVEINRREQLERGTY